MADSLIFTVRDNVSDTSGCTGMRKVSNCEMEIVVGDASRFPGKKYVYVQTPKVFFRDNNLIFGMDDKLHRKFYRVVRGLEKDLCRSLASFPGVEVSQKELYKECLEGAVSTVESDDGNDLCFSMDIRVSETKGDIMIYDKGGFERNMSDAEGKEVRALLRLDSLSVLEGSRLIPNFVLCQVQVPSPPRKKIKGYTIRDDEDSFVVRKPSRKNLPPVFGGGENSKVSETKVSEKMEMEFPKELPPKKKEEVVTKIEKSEPKPDPPPEKSTSVVLVDGEEIDVSSEDDESE